MPFRSYRIIPSQDQSADLTPTHEGRAHAPRNALKILVAEEDPLLAEQLAADIEMAGNHVLGPFPSPEMAAPFAAEAQAAIIDIHLGQHSTFSLAHQLRAMKCPFVFYSTFTAQALPMDLRNVSLHSKPSSTIALLADLSLQYRQLTLQQLILSLLPYLRLRARQLVHDQATADRLLAATLTRSIASAQAIGQIHVTPLLFRQLEDEFVRYGREYMI